MTDSAGFLKPCYLLIARRGVGFKSPPMPSPKLGVELVLYTVSHSKRPAMSVSRDDSPAVMSGNETR